MEDSQLKLMKDTWWLILLRGLALIFFGIAAIVWPVITAYLLTLFFAAYMLVDGVVSVITGIAGIGRQRYWFLLLLAGILQVFVGIFAFKYTGFTTITLVVLIGATFIARGILEVISAFDKNNESKSKALVIILGVLSILAGIVLVAFPGAGVVALAWVLGAYGLVAGPLFIALSIHVKNLVDDEETEGSEKKSSK